MTELSRRQILRGMGITVGALTAATALPGGLLDAMQAVAASPEPPTSLTLAQALARLQAGNRRFVRDKLRHPRRDDHRRAALAEGYPRSRWCSVAPTRGCRPR